MKAALVVIVVAGVLSVLPVLPACGGGQTETEEPEARSSPPPVRRQDYRRPVSGEGKKWSGWRWKGEHDTCGWVYKNECFTSAQAACRKAGCAVDDCRQDDSAPVKVRCPR